MGAHAALVKPANASASLSGPQWACTAKWVMTACSTAWPDLCHTLVRQDLAFARSSSSRMLLVLSGSAKGAAAGEGPAGEGAAPAASPEASLAMYPSCSKKQVSGMLDGSQSRGAACLAWLC